MSATCRRHVGDTRHCRQILPTWDVAADALPTCSPGCCESSQFHHVGAPLMVPLKLGGMHKKTSPIIGFHGQLFTWKIHPTRDPTLEIILTTRRQSKKYLCLQPSRHRHRHRRCHRCRHHRCTFFFQTLLNL